MRPHYLCLCLLTLSGCAMASNREWMTVKANRPGITCTLSNDLGTWRINPPARVLIRKSAVPVKVQCDADDGWSATKEIALPSTPVNTTFQMSPKP